MARNDDDLIFDAANRADRPVLNTSDTPEFINLATHYKDRGAAADVKDVESLQFTEGSLDFNMAFEDDRLISGQVSPVARQRARQVHPTVRPSAASRPAVRENRPAADGIPPYRDIPGTYATVGEPVFQKAPKEEHYVSIPISMAALYNPAVLIFAIIMLMFLIAFEIMGVIYVF